MTHPKHNLIQTFLTRGLLWSVPVGLTLWLIGFAFKIADNILGPFTSLLLNFLLPDWLLVGPLADGHSPLVSFFLLMLLLTLLGGFVSWRYGERMVRFLDSWLKKLPGLGFLYRSIRSMADHFDSGSPFERVVLIPYPHAGLFTIAFVAGHVQLKDEAGKETAYLKVVVPNPPTGVQGIVMVPEKDARDVPLSVEDGIGFYMSLGTVSPPMLELGKKHQKGVHLIAAAYRP